MSWTWRKPRVPVQPGWQAPHELVNDHAARGVEIARLTGALASAENMMIVAQKRFAESQRTVKSQADLILDLTARIERQADNHEEDRAEWAEVKSRLTARVSELEQLLVRADADHAELSGRLQDAGLDAAWPEVAALVNQKSLGGK